MKEAVELRCARCGKVMDPPVYTSRIDGKDLCKECSSREAMTVLGIPEVDQARILQQM